MLAALACQNPVSELSDAYQQRGSEKGAMSEGRGLGRRQRRERRGSGEVSDAHARTGSACVRFKREQCSALFRLLRTRIKPAALVRHPLYPTLPHPTLFRAHS